MFKGQINSFNDAFHERYAEGYPHVGNYDIPAIPRTYANPTGCRAVAFTQAAKERKPKECMCHFFIDDFQFERFWTDADKYIEMLKNFKYVCTPDFSLWDSMSRSMRIYNTYRNRALAVYMHDCGIRIIQTVEPSADSWEFCFDGIEKNTTVAITTNGIGESADLQNQAQENIDAMTAAIEPERIVVVGKIYDLNFHGAEVIQFPSFGEQMKEKLGVTIQTPQMSPRDFELSESVEVL